jgi:HAMP domain-containing protein
MKRWPLRWKLALYAAALAVIATMAGAATTWAIILSTDPAIRAVSRVRWDIFLGMLGAIPTVLIVIAIGGRWVAKQALAPVEAITYAAARVSVQNLDQRLPVPQTEDEIAELVRVLNATLDRLQRSFEQSVRFSAEASHHLKTPISVLRVGIEEILTDPETPAKQQTRADALLHQIHQLTSVAENLLLLARADAGRLELHLPIEVVGAGFDGGGDGDRRATLLMFFEEVCEIDAQVEARALADEEAFLAQPGFAVLDAAGGIGSDAPDEPRERACRAACPAIACSTSSTPIAVAQPWPIGQTAWLHGRHAIDCHST